MRNQQLYKNRPSKRSRGKIIKHAKTDWILKQFLKRGWLPAVTLTDQQSKHSRQPDHQSRQWAFITSGVHRLHTWLTFSGECPSAAASSWSPALTFRFFFGPALPVDGVVFCWNSFSCRTQEQKCLILNISYYTDSQSHVCADTLKLL